MKKKVSISSNGKVRSGGEEEGLAGVEVCPVRVDLRPTAAGVGKDGVVGSRDEVCVGDFAHVSPDGRAERIVATSIGGDVTETVFSRDGIC